MMKQIIKEQRSFFNTGATKAISFRIEKLKKLEYILKQNQENLNEAIFADFGKSYFDSYTSEMALLFHDIKEAKRKLKKWSATKRVRTNLINFPAKSYIVPEPLGVALVIGAWNYPIQLSLAPVIAAIAAGNTVVLKPSELPSNTSAALAKMVNENFDSNFFKVVEGGVKETTELLNQKFDKVFFTGSVPVGKIVYQAAAKNLTPVTLELGGKSPAFFTESCNLKTSVKRMVWAKFLNAGQTCVAPDYIFVHRAIKDEFLKAIKQEIENAKLSIENHNYVQIINEKNMHRLISLIDKEKVHYGGYYNIEERYMEPTIMTNVTFDDRIMQDEIFGPILPIIEYDNIDKAIAEVKARPKPLSCYVFTKDKQIKNKILNEVSFGGGGVNDALMHLANSKLPFGGVGDSGIGSYHGEYGFKAFSHFKSVLDKPTWIEPNLKYYPLSLRKLKLIKLIMGQRN